MCLCVWISDLLDHDGDVLVQVAAVELHQIYKNMEKIGGKTYVHPQEDKACWRQERTEREQVNKVCNSPVMPQQIIIANMTTKMIQMS